MVSQLVEGTALKVMAAPVLVSVKDWAAGKVTLEACVKESEAGVAISSGLVLTSNVTGTVTLGFEAPNAEIEMLPEYVPGTVGSADDETADLCAIAGN